MPSASQPLNDNSSNRRAPRVLGCCLLTPVVLALCLYTAYKIDNIELQITVQTHSVPPDNARTYFQRAFAASKLMTHKSPYDMITPPAQRFTLGNYQACAADAEPALMVMREGLNRPFMNPAVRSSNAIFPELAGFRGLERVNEGAADYYAVTGKPGRAMQMRLDGLEMGVMIPRGGVLIHALVGVACESIAESRIEPLIPALSAAELGAAAVRLDRIASKRISYADMITEEGYAQTAGLLETLKDPKTRANAYKAAIDMVGGGFEDDTTSLRERMSVRIEALKFAMQNKSAILHANSDWYAAKAMEARSAYTGKSQIPVPNNLLAELTGGIFDQCRLKWVSVDATLALLRVEVALYRYRKVHGMFPNTLADLAPVYLLAVPVDPCGGKPLHYTLKDGGTAFQLYSIGPDLKDDLGRPAKYVGAEQGDIVAGKMYNNRPILYPGLAVKQ